MNRIDRLFNEILALSFLIHLTLVSLALNKFFRVLREMLNQMKSNLRFKTPQVSYAKHEVVRCETLYNQKYISH